MDSCRLHADAKPLLATVRRAPRTRTMGPMIALPVLSTVACGRATFPDRCPCDVDASVVYWPPFAFSSERYELALRWFYGCACVGCCRVCCLQFDQWSGVAGVDARHLRVVGAGRIGYFELPAAHASFGADDARPGLDGIARRIERVARDADAFGVWIYCEGAACGIGRWWRARAGVAVRCGALCGLRGALRRRGDPPRWSRPFEARPARTHTYRAKTYWRFVS